MSKYPKWLGLSVIAFTLVVAGAMAQAQQPKKIPTIGYLSSASAASTLFRTEPFQRGLQALGYVEGKNIVIEYRYAEGKVDRLPALAAELVHLKVDVIVTAGPVNTRAAKQATNTIPIIMTQDPDPIGSGFVASLAHPGGNITGLSTLTPELSGKRLELLKEILPRLSAVAVLGQFSNGHNAQALKEIELAAGMLRVKVQRLDIQDRKDIETAFREANKERADAVLTLPFPPYIETRIAELALKHRLPAIYFESAIVVKGGLGLMSYGVSLADLDRRAATYVDKILKGAKPTDLPVEQPTKFELVINLKTAKQIGLTIPPNVLARADRVIK
jgi:putative ABC transport system substrate-binding protein